MTTSFEIAIAGVAGRMGRQLVSASMAAGHMIVGGTEQAGSAALDSDIGTLAGLAPTGIVPSVSIAQAARGAKAWIDFTRPDVTLNALSELSETEVTTVIIGTTGFSDAQIAQIKAHAKRFAIVQAGNFSLGIALMTRLTELAAERLGTGWDIEVLETHHRHKIDAPSGTALMLGEAAAKGRGTPLETLREGPYNGPDAKREPGKIGFSVRRSGGVIGEHDVSLTSETERISISHSALDRRVFADGAVKAAEWAQTRAPGLYTIHDVLGL